MSLFLKTPFEYILLVLLLIGYIISRIDKWSRQSRVGRVDVRPYEKNVPEELNIHHEVEKRPKFIENERRLDKAYKRWKFIAKVEARKLRKSERWEGDYPPLEMDLEGFPKWFYPLIPKEDFGYNEFKTLAARTNPNCGSIKRLAVAVRKVIRAKKKAVENYDSAINFLYRLAVLYEILDQLYFSIDDRSHKTRLHSFLAVSDLEDISIDYDKIGYDKLSLLNKTDRSIIRAKWGSPREHHGPLEMFPAVINNCVSRDFWEGSRRDSVPIEDWIKGRLSSEIEFAREMEKNDRFCSASQTIKSLGDVYIVIDIETTGLSSVKDEIVEIAALKVEGGRLTGDGFSSLVRIEGQIPYEATRINGITQRMLERDGQSLEAVLRTLMDFIGDNSIVAHYAKFDIDFIDSALERRGMELWNKIHCSLKVARKAFPERSSLKLKNIADDLGLSTRGSHRAENDCKTTVKVFEASLDRLRN